MNRIRLHATAFLAGTLLLASGNAGAVDRTVPPVPGPVRPLKLPPVKRVALSNGLPVLIVESHEVPIVTLVLLIKSGAAEDPLPKIGLAALTAGMLDEGAGGKNSLALDDALSYLGADLKAAATWDGSIVDMEVPVARLEAALPLMADVALRPDFPAKELERVRRDELTGILEARSEPRQIASWGLSRAIFGKGHRYGSPADGDATSLAALSVADLRSFHEKHYRPANATLIVTGDVQGAQLVPLLEKAFGSWAAGGGAPAPVPAPAQLKGRKLWLVDKPGAAQSVIRIGRVGPDRRTSDYEVLEVMNTLLGGSFTSRLNNNLREQHGWAYGAGSGFDYRRTGGVFLAAADVQSKSTGEAMVEFMKELERMKTPPTPKEIERARNFLALRFAEQFETSRQMAAKLAEIVLYDLPIDTFDSFVPKALAVSSDQMVRAARAQIDTGNLAIVIVGDRATIEKPLQALKLGTFQVLSVDDVMGPAPKLE
ncbi:MAG: pitrilysin family protein [Thermoanaerobaculia bacterium]